MVSQPRDTCSRSYLIVFSQAIYVIVAHESLTTGALLSPAHKSVNTHSNQQDDPFDHFWHSRTLVHENKTIGCHLPFLTNSRLRKGLELMDRYRLCLNEEPHR